MKGERLKKAISFEGNSDPAGCTLGKFRYRRHFVGMDA